MAIQMHSMSTFLAEQLATAKAQAYRDRGTYKQSVIEAIRRDDPSEARVLEGKLEDAKQAAEQLSLLRKGTAKSHKADAAEKVKRIKAEIQAIRMAGGDPKAVARRIAQLARELASAAREYATAGGGEGSQATVDSDTQSPTATAGGASLNAQSAAAAMTAVDAVAQTAQNSAESDTPPSSAENERQSQEQKAQFVAGIERRLNEMRETAAEAREDQEFMQEVRNLAAQLKALAKQQEAKLKQMKEQVGNASDFVQAMAEIEKAVAQIEGKASSTSLVIDVTA